MKIINLNKKQISEIEDKFDAFDESPIHYKMEGRILIGIEEDGEVVAGLDACFTTFKIMYVSTMFVDERYRRKGCGTRLMREMERRAAEMGATLIRLDTFDWQGKDFYEALGYEIVGSYENVPEGYAEYFFVKRLGTGEGIGE